MKAPITTYREEAVARSICSSRGDAEENQPAIMEGDCREICRSGGVNNE